MTLGKGEEDATESETSNYITAVAKETDVLCCIGSLTSYNATRLLQRLREA